jgi:guanylate kinase
MAVLPGILYIIVAPSGAGKTSLVKALVASLENAKISVSYTTRKKRSVEREGLDYHFISLNEFNEKINQGLFLEYANVFGCYYGTAKDWVLTELNEGIDVILEIDWQGANQVRTLFPDSVTLFILPPSLEILKERLINRGQDAMDVINCRIQEASMEISHYSEFDYLIVNNIFEEAVRDLEFIFKAERLKQIRQRKRYKALLEKLIINR